MEAVVPAGSNPESGASLRGSTSENSSSQLLYANGCITWHK